MKKNRILWIISLVPLFVTLVVLPYISEKVPMHSDINGTIDRLESKYEELIFPIIILVVSLMWQGMINYFNKKSIKYVGEKEGAEAEANSKILYLVAIASAIIFAIMHFSLLYLASVEAIKNTESRMIDMNVITNILVAIMMVIVGNYLPRVKRNSIVGFRTKKSLSDDSNWKRTNRFAGISLMIVGVLIIIETLLIKGIWSTVIMVAILLIVSIVDLVYSAML